jgi:hypothetical protein
MTMLGPVTTLRPGDGNHPAVAPFYDGSLGGVRFTGKYQFSSSGCTKLNVTQTKCIERTSRTQYRALTYAKLDFASTTETSYATAAAPHLAPVSPVLPQTRSKYSGWQTVEGTLP